MGGAEWGGHRREGRFEVRILALIFLSLFFFFLSIELFAFPFVNQSNIPKLLGYI